jgi:PDZ domain
MRVLLGLLTVGWLLPAAVAADPAKEARRKEADKRFAKLNDYCKERRVPHVVELLAEWGEFADQTQQDAVAAMAKSIFEDAQAEVKASGDKGVDIMFPKVGSLGVSADADLIQKAAFASAYFVDEYRTERPPGRGALPQDSLNVAREQVVVAARTLSARPVGTTKDSVVLTNANSAVFLNVEKCVVLASGDMEVDLRIDRSVVVCRGNLTYNFETKRGGSSLVKAGGSITHVRAAWFASQGLPVAQPVGTCVVQKDTKLLGAKFYSATEDGLEATAEKEVVTVKAVDEKKPFSKAGVKKGDVVESINGQKVPSLHELDRLLCRATVASGVAKLKLKRGDTAEELEVKLADW